MAKSPLFIQRERKVKEKTKDTRSGHGRKKTWKTNDKTPKNMT